MYNLKIIITCFFLGINTLVFAQPVPASCTPITLNYCCSFGITNITFNTINNNSNDGTDGYSDFTTMSTTVLEGQVYILSIQTLALSTQNYAAWIDFNNDGIFDDVTERIFTAASQSNTSGSITIPTGAVLNTDLRLRIIADYDLSAPPTPCGNPDRGQAEDYTVVIISNPNPPIAGFSAPDTITCDGAICFTDESLNIPTSWLWYFGDGSTSLQQNPCYTYAMDGDYTVSLIATNANGSDADTIINYITVNVAGQVIAPSCSPVTTSYCCDYGIYQVIFVNINNTTVNAVEGYQDFSCSNTTVVTEGVNYLFTATTGASAAQDTRVWIDFNNDGVFNNTTELVMDAPNSFNPSQNILIPTGATLNTPLRLRISSDIVGVAQNACDDNDRGQTEDYSIVINLPDGIDDLISLENSIVVYPNPVSETVYIKNLTVNQKLSNIAIYNNVGQQVLNVADVNNELTTINISNYPKGFYFLKIETEKGVVTKKITIY